MRMRLKMKNVRQFSKRTSHDGADGPCGIPRVRMEVGYRQTEARVRLHWNFFKKSIADTHCPNKSQSDISYSWNIISPSPQFYHRQGRVTSLELRMPESLLSFADAPKQSSVLFCRCLHTVTFQSHQLSSAHFLSPGIVHWAWSCRWRAAWRGNQRGTRAYRGSDHLNDVDLWSFYRILSVAFWQHSRVCSLI